MQVPEAWTALSEHVAKHPGLTVLVGASDTGKTTLAKFLISRWTSHGRSVAFVDGDMGQSTIGPPGTLGWKLFDAPVDADHIPDQENPNGLFFIGSFSPVGHLLQTVVGVQTLVRQARAADPDLILVDTTGLVFGGIGEHLKYRKLQLLRPRHAVFLQRRQELQHLRRLVASDVEEVHELRASSEVRRRFREDRHAYRRERLDAYFHGAEVVEIPFPDVVVWNAGHFTGVPLAAEELSFCSRILEGRILYGELGGGTLFLVKKEALSYRYQETVKRKFAVNRIFTPTAGTFRDQVDRALRRR